MDVFARAFITADKFLKESDYLKLRKDRYSSFDGGKGAAYEAGKLTFENLREIAAEVGEPKQISGKQEKFEQMINFYI